MGIIQRIKINIHYILHLMMKIWTIFFPLYWGVTFSNYFSFFRSFTNNIVFLLGVLIISFIISIIFSLYVNHRVIFTSITNKKLEVEYGDIFNSNSKIRVIPVNRCFDTVVNDSLIAQGSLHGMLILKHLTRLNYEEFVYKVKESLKKFQGEVCENKIEGNKIRYPIGTIVEIYDGDICYYLLALTKMEKDNRAYCTAIDYYKAIYNLMTYYDIYGQGKDMTIPVLGSGFSRLNQKEQTLLEILVSTIKMFQNKMRGNIKIVVYKENREFVSITDF